MSYQSYAIVVIDGKEKTIKCKDKFPTVQAACGSQIALKKDVSAAGYKIIRSGYVNDSPKPLAKKTATPKKIPTSQKVHTTTPKRTLHYSKYQPEYFKLRSYRGMYEKYVRALNDMMAKMPPFKYTYWGENRDIHISTHYDVDSWDSPKSHEGEIFVWAKTTQDLSEYDMIKYILNSIGFRDFEDYHSYDVHARKWDASKTSRDKAGMNLSIWVKPTLVIPGISLPNKPPVITPPKIRKTDPNARIVGKGRIDMEDDIVAVYDPNGKCIYKGLEDYDDMKHEDWKYDSSMKRYYVDIEGERYIKILVK